MDPQKKIFSPPPPPPKKKRIGTPPQKNGPSTVFQHNILGAHKEYRQIYEYAASVIYPASELCIIGLLHHRLTTQMICMTNRPGCIRGFSRNIFVIDSLIHSFIQSSFSPKPSKNQFTKTIRARELNFFENVHPPPGVTCHVSSVRCHMPGVTFQGVKLLYLFLLLFLFFSRTKW